MSHPSTSHISVSVRSKGKCPVCGKRTERSATFYAPRSIDGKPLSAVEAYRNASAQADNWKPDHHHRKC